jgi:HlyD family secretion protein
MSHWFLIWLNIGNRLKHYELPIVPNQARSMSRKQIAILAIVLAVVAGGALSAWAAFLRPITVQVARVEHDVPVQVFGLGTVEARVTSKVGFKVSGVLIDVRADVGDHIAKGVVLAQLDDREQRARVARAEAAGEQTRANLQKALASVAKAKANYANAKNINTRRQTLLQSHNTSVEQADISKAAEEATQADVDLAESEVTVARAGISDAKAQGQQEAATLDFHTLTSPYDAMVIARQKELGAALAAGEPVFTLIDPKQVWVLAYIDESKAGEIQIGEPAEIVLRSRPSQRFKGRVARIEPESDRVNEERRVEVTFDQLPDNFHLGEQAEVYITTMQLTEALLLPEAAIVGLGKSQGTVWTVEDGHLQQRKVTLGHRLLDGRHEITGGAPDKAMVISQLGSGFRVGRAAQVAVGPSP